jgi:hypothetical protein
MISFAQAVPKTERRSEVRMRVANGVSLRQLLEAAPVARFGSSSTRDACPLHVGLRSDRCRLVATKIEVKGQNPTNSVA